VQIVDVVRADAYFMTEHCGYAPLDNAIVLMGLSYYLAFWQRSVDLKHASVRATVGLSNQYLVVQWYGIPRNGY